MKIILMVIVLVIITVSALSSVSCQTAWPGPLETVTIGTLQLETSTLLFIAEDQQFFTKNGLIIENKYFETGLGALNALLKGEVNIAVPVGEFAFAGKILNKESIKTIGCNDKVDYQSITARKDRGIETPKDLTGKNIGVILGTQQEFYAMRFLDLNGVKNAQLTGINLSQAMEAITNGQIDAVVTPPPYTEAILERLGSRAITWSVQSDQMTQQLMICKNEWVTQHPKTIERFIKSLVEAQSYLVVDPEKAKLIVQNKLGINEKDVTRIWLQNQFGLSLDQSLLLAMEDETRWMIRNNMTTAKTVPNLLEYIYTDALKAVKPEVVRIAGK